MDVFDSSEMLEAKLLAGGSGYDVIVPNGPVLRRFIQAATLQKVVGLLKLGLERVHWCLAWFGRARNAIGEELRTDQSAAPAGLDIRVIPYGVMRGRRRRSADRRGHTQRRSLV